MAKYSIADGSLGPSFEHVITKHPAVVDLLISFAHTAASTDTRMALPLQLQ